MFSQEAYILFCYVFSILLVHIDIFHQSYHKDHISLFFFLLKFNLK